MANTPEASVPGLTGILLFPGPGLATADEHGGETAVDHG